ncbi:MAG: hypothetical protein LBP86_03005 [Azoarcus sp.]|nr:hypothetical protein [Azoarcus sp.]
MSVLNKSRIGAALSCVAFAVALTACSDETKLDGSSEKAFQKSAQKVMESLPKDKQKKFGEAIGVVMFAGVGEASAAVLSQGAGGALEEVEKKMLEKLNGKTADEVIAMAEELKQKIGAQ